ncbi:hypothetical protein Aph02nite_48510 [Actinoplanes philippinensis]|uniref:Uncharacterized protein n=1 Tax=Actinoplanes philippinensis TaxID=35752 RepID=A0A1I2HWG4_9ACTN|nr:hypothetical protein [Actinoplanes philippinensis]GIE78901.1 hypothetical protein Aph02nite_48510 [Actinoplanes philippinensis]SFF34384.1 hypothetical protein SAMN05421541_10936 [Actinoplanes philippinensis]
MDYYASPNTVLGALQRGLGRGAHGAASTLGAAGPVTACLEDDWRWDTQVDEREVYLARLVRDLRMPIAPVIGLLDGEKSYPVALGVLEALGRAGIGAAVDGVRDHVRRGVRWVDALETVARTWPPEYWEDLYPLVADRIDGIGEYDAWWPAAPWTVWADRDERIAAAIQATSNRHERPRRPFADTPAATLLDLLRQGQRADDWSAALGELRRRPPEPAVLEIAEDLAGERGAGRLHGVIEEMGDVAVPAARRWVTVADHPLTWTALRVLAAHGDAGDAPALAAGLEWLDARPNDRCGYHDLARGLARVGGPAAVAVVSRLHQLWFSPHSYERAGYLDALVTLDADGAQRKIVEGLWDCEADVRLLAVRHTPMDDLLRRRLEYLRDDPMETAEVRAAATGRLTGR